MTKIERVQPDLKFVQKIVDNGGGSVKRCFQCATCSVVCTLSPKDKPFPRKEMLWAQWGLKDRLVGDPDIWLCHHCGDCTVHCPRGAKPGETLQAVRASVISELSFPKVLAEALNRPKLFPALLLMPMLLLGVEKLFRPEADADGAYLLLWALVAYLGWTLVAIPYSAWGAELSDQRHERTRIAAAREGFVIVGTLAALAVPALAGVAADPASTLALMAQWLWWVLPVAVLLTVGLVPAAPSQATRRPPWREGLRLLARNRPLRRLLLAYVVNGTANGLPATLFVLFVAQVLQARELTGPLLAIYFAAGIVALPAWVWLARRVGKTRAWTASLVLACLGVFFSWLLYRYQSAYLQKITDFERKLAREREDAALGRATATITHEIRNPLNAISMGLQRIELEADELSPEHRELAASMRQAVKRTNTIVGDLLRYSRPMEARRDPVNLTELVDGILLLYKPQCQVKNITVSHHSTLARPVPGDAELLGQLFENIIKNAVEAQPGGGYISVNSIIENNQARLSIDNAMPRGSVDNLSQLLEPYFTTKTRGTGLGLPIARRIAQAHNGALTLATPDQDIFRAVITLPLVGYSGG